MKPLFICDLDGTLAENTHRKHLAPPKHLMNDDKEWHTWGEACDGDFAIPAVKTTIGVLLAGGADVWFWSARSARHIDKTAFWIMKHGLGLGDTGVEWAINFLKERHGLRMRPDGHCQKDHDLKKDWLRSMPIEDRTRLVAVLEDRTSVVDMWRKEGVPCFQVAKNDW